MTRKDQARNLLDAVFFEASMVSEERFQLKPDLETEKPTPEVSGAVRKSVADKLKELTGILGKLGIDKASDRLEVCGDCFHLNCDHEQHTKDSDTLFDFAKIQPLIDKGYVTVDKESDGQKWTIIILASDSLPDMDVPDADDLEAVKFDNGKEESLSVDTAKVDLLAEQLVRKITNR
jgi:hypothetical protein